MYFHGSIARVYQLWFNIIPDFKAWWPPVRPDSIHNLPDESEEQIESSQHSLTNWQRDCAKQPIQERSLKDAISHVQNLENSIAVALLSPNLCSSIDLAPNNRLDITRDDNSAVIYPWSDHSKHAILLRVFGLKSFCDKKPDRAQLNILHKWGT